MKKYFLLLLLSLPLLSVAQSNYKSGLIVNAKGDTLRGYIDFKEWGHNPKNIYFKQAISDKARELGTADISYFDISGLVSYKRYAVSISLNSVDLSSPSAGFDTTFKTEAVFLQVLQNGANVTLYAYTDGLKSRYYIQDNNMAIPEELVYGISEGANSSNVIYKNGYQEQLNRLAVKYNQGTDKLFKQIHDAKYDAGDLSSIVEKINGNTSGKMPAHQGSNNPGFRFFVGAGFISSTLKYSDDGPYYGSSPSTSASPKGTIGIDAIVNPNVGRLIFRLELGYSANSFSFQEQPNPLYNIADPELSTAKIKQNVLFITPQVVYNIYNTATLKVFIDAGYSINVLSYPTYTVTNKRDGQTLSTVNAKDDPDLEDNYATFQFKAGVVLNKRFEIYGAFFPSAQITSSSAYNTSLTSYQIGLNYFIGKVAN